MKVTRKKTGIFLFVLALFSSSLWAGTVSGLVTNARTNQPVANAKVLISGGPYQDSAFTDMLGQYGIFNVPTGSYTLIATAPLFNSIVRTGVAVTANPLTQNFNLQVTATIRGAVTNSANGNAVAGAPVVLIWPSSFAETTFTDAQGFYLFDSVTNGANYLITVTAAGFQTAVNNTVTITDGRRAGIADFSLVPIGTSGTGSVTGVVASGNSGALIAGAKVVLSLAGQPVDSVFADSLGRYQFSGVAPDTVNPFNHYSLTASAATYNNAVRNNVAVNAGQTAVVDLNLQSNLGTVAGQVTSRAAGNPPIANALVRIYDNGGILLDSARTDAQGYYDIFNVPPAGGYTLIATAPLFNSMIITGVNVVAVNWTTQNFNLQVTATIRGTVTNSANGNPVVRAEVVLTLPTSGSFVPETLFTDAQGMYLFDSVSNSGGTTYQITVTAAGFQTAFNNTVRITDALRSGFADFNLIPVTIGGRATGSVSGTIASGNSGQPLVGAMVTIIGGAVADTTYTDSLGHYLFAAVDTALGGYTVTASAAAFTNAVRSNVGVLLGQTTVVDLNPFALGILSPKGWAARRTHWINGRLILELAPARVARNVEVFGANGAMRHRIPVPPGATRAEMPADVGRTELIFVR